MMSLLLEALGAGLLFIFIIWWTMFSGRKNGELPDANPRVPDGSAPAGADTPNQNAPKEP